MSDLLGMGVKVDGSQASFRLERGATGFCDLSDPPLPETDPRVCRTALHATARAARGQVRNFEEQRYPQTFHSGTIDNRDGTHVVLFHAQYPLIAFVGDQRHPSPDEFQDPPAWATILNDFGFTVLGASLLLSPPTGADTTALSTAELRQIEQWQPNTLGSTLFNSWD
ncbi:hypothetical protein ACFY12_08605 [Streptomyces sp. NPDC001339]|uniref:hypothetical protein n=1 Tax=Streptomyces sp. NPDC001339 TaxID=3364563 RepID=UPI0036B9CCC4